MQEICTSLNKLPKSKQVRNFMYVVTRNRYQLIPRLDEERKPIQTFTALLLQLLQCCTGLPPAVTDTMNEFEDQSINCYDQAVSHSQSFASALIARCALTES